MAVDTRRALGYLLNHVSEQILGPYEKVIYTTLEQQRIEKQLAEGVIEIANHTAVLVDLNKEQVKQLARLAELSDNQEEELYGLGRRLNLIVLIPTTLQVSAEAWRQHLEMVLEVVLSAAVAGLSPELREKLDRAMEGDK